MFYDNDKYYFDTLKFDDVFTSATDFAAKLGTVGDVTDTSDLEELYEILALKYVGAHTRYTDEFAFIFAIKRELYTEFAFYLEKKDLAKQLRDMEISKITLTQNQLRNVVTNRDEPVSNPDTVAIDNLSTEQENIRVTANELEAVKQKYNVMNRNYLQGIYKRCDDLFRVILSDDVRYLYEREE